MSFKYSLLLFLALLLTASIQAQDTAIVSSKKILSNYPDKISAKANQIEKKLDRKTEKLLAQMQKQEIRMKKKLSGIDSLKAAKVFGSTELQYKQLEQRLNQKTSELKNYIPSLDTLSSSIKFLQQNPHLISSSKEAQKKLENALGNIKDLESQFQKAEEIKKFLKERRQYLKEQLGHLGFAKEFKKLNKQAYYYGQQVNEYKAILKDRKRIEKKTMEVLTKTTLFKKFMQKNGQLAGLFRLPGNESSLTNGAGAIGLQSRAQIQSALQNQSGMASMNPQQRVQQGLGQARGQLDQMKQKVQQFGGNSSDVELPDFQPNSQKTKSFIRKFEVSANVQSAKHNNLFPVTSDIGLSLEFKPSDKLITGIGAAYRMGWGSGFKNIHITHQGIGIRSFVEFKAKGKLFISGGYEQNYFAVIKTIEQLKDQKAWKSSALLGLSKKYKVGKKKNGEMKLLYDFFSTRKAPRTQPLLFRVGFGF